MERNHNWVHPMIEIIELDAKKMEVLKEIANSNLLVAQMKAELMELEKGKEDFFAKRENEVLGRIHKLLNNSRILIDEANTNYTLVHNFYETLKGFSDYLKKAHAIFKESVAEFQEKSQVWQNAREQEISDLRKALKFDQDSLDRDKEFIKSKKAELEKEKKYIEEQQESLNKNRLELEKLWNQKK